MKGMSTGIVIGVGAVLLVVPLGGALLLRRAWGGGSGGAGSGAGGQAPTGYTPPQTYQPPPPATQQQVDPGAAVGLTFLQHGLDVGLKFLDMIPGFGDQGAVAGGSAPTTGAVLQ